MDALKLMSESCLKKDLPVVNVGDTVACRFVFRRVTVSVCRPSRAL